MKNVSHALREPQEHCHAKSILSFNTEIDSNPNEKLTQGRKKCKNTPSHQIEGKDGT